MKIETGENGAIELSEIYNGITLVAADGSKIIVHSRDRGFEIECATNYKSTKYTFSQKGVEAMAKPKSTLSDLEESWKRDNQKSLDNYLLSTGKKREKSILKGYKETERLFSDSAQKKREQYQISISTNDPIKVGVHEELEKAFGGAYSKFEISCVNYKGKNPDTVIRIYDKDSGSVMDIISATRTNVRSIESYLTCEKDEIKSKWKERVFGYLSDDLGYVEEGDEHTTLIPITPLDKAELLSLTYFIKELFEVTIPHDVTNITFDYAFVPGEILKAIGGLDHHTIFLIGHGLIGGYLKII